MANKGDLKVWWIPQIPMKPFEVPVKTIHEAKLILDTLAKYDLFQFEKHIKPDYSNTGGLEVYDSGEAGMEWGEWYDEDDNDIDDTEED